MKPILSLFLLACIVMSACTAFAGQPATIKDLRCSSTSDYTRVVLELTDSAGFSVNRLRNPDRLYIDLEGSKVRPDAERSVTVGDGLLGNVRYGQFNENTVRVVMDIGPESTYKVFRLDGPPRVVVDFFRKGSHKAASKEPSAQMSSRTMIQAREKLQELERRKAELKAKIEARKAPGNAAKRTGKATAAPAVALKRAEEARRAADEAHRAQEAKRAEEARKAEVARQQKIAAQKARKEADLRKNQEEEARKLAEARAKAIARSSRSGAPVPVVSKKAYKPSKSKNVARKPQRFRRHRVVVDAGHGGKDPGAMSRRGHKEKHVVLDIAKRLKRKLEKTGGYEVILTRSSDKYLELEDRAKIANRKDADIFVSIHANASRNKRSRGLETYYLNKNSDEETIKIAARENGVPIEKMKRAMDTTNWEYMLASLATQRKQYQSGRLAKVVREKMYSAVRSRYHGVTTKRSSMGPFYVLYGARMPAVLVEVSYMSNKTEASRLATSTYRDYLAGGIAEGIRAYLNSIPSASGLAKR